MYPHVLAYLVDIITAKSITFSSVLPHVDLLWVGLSRLHKQKRVIPINSASDSFVYARPLALSTTPHT